MLGRGQAALLLLLGFGGVSVLLALLYITIRRYVFRDADNLNTTFDAGGRVSMSLTAVTVASQLMWPGDLLQSATVTIKVGAWLLLPLLSRCCYSYSHHQGRGLVTVTAKVLLQL